MSDPSYEDCLLREWAPLDTLLQQIPLKAHRGLFTHELNLTCIDALLDFIAVGSNLGLVYWYSRRTGNLQTFRFENSTSAITCIKVISTVDYMLAAGNEHGVITVFQIPKDPPHSLPESVKPKRKKQIERYTISGLHSSPVTAIEWSLNGMKLFSGDKNGLVVLTEIDFYMHLSKSVELLNEKYEIVQLSYSQQLLLVSTTYRSILCQRDDRWRVSQVGQKERKVLGRLGATFYQNGEKPKELIVYASRPGLRLWLADKNGVVEQTLIYKDTMIRGHRLVPLINPAPAHLRQERVDHTFGPLLVFKDKLLVTYSHDMVYVLDTCDIFVVATVADLRSVQDISVTKNEIFILEGNRNIVRVACLPECLLVPGQDYAGDVLIEPPCGQLSRNDVFLYIVGHPQVQKKIIKARSKEDQIWLHVAAEMTKLGFSFGEKGALLCAKKWNSMVRRYKIYKENNQWKSQSHVPSYIDTLEKIFSTKSKNSMKTGALPVISVATINRVPLENHPKRRKLASDEAIESDSLLSSALHFTSSVKELEELQMTNDDNNVFIDLMHSEADTVYYEDEHVTVYPEPSNPGLHENITVSSSDLKANNNVLVIVTPSFIKFPGNEEDLSTEECLITGEEDSPLEGNVCTIKQELKSSSGEIRRKKNSHKLKGTERPMSYSIRALKALSSRVYEEEQERDKMRKQNIERRFEQIEAAIYQQGVAIQELTRKTVNLLSPF